MGMPYWRALAAFPEREVGGNQKPRPLGHAIPGDFQTTADGAVDVLRTQVSGGVHQRAPLAHLPAVAVDQHYADLDDAVMASRKQARRLDIDDGMRSR
jgi:hypothetical protein